MKKLRVIAAIAAWSCILSVGFLTFHPEFICTPVYVFLVADIIIVAGTGILEEVNDLIAYKREQQRRRNNKIVDIRRRR